MDFCACSHILKTNPVIISINPHVNVDDTRLGKSDESGNKFRNQVRFSSCAIPERHLKRTPVLHTEFLGKLSQKFTGRGEVAGSSWSKHGSITGPTALFTGIVEEMGKVRELSEVDGSWELTVEASVVLGGVKLGDSIAINGTCLTVTEFDGSSFRVGLAPETLRKTSLGELSVGSFVNLERSLLPDSRMGGHFVQGHVDNTGIITSFRPEGDSLWVTIQTSPSLLRYIVPKGYIAVDGTSLTVVDVLDETNSFTFMLVSYTQSKIVVPLKKPGDKVNLEVDIVGKYVERMMQGYRIKAFEDEQSYKETSKIGDWGSMQ